MKNSTAIKRQLPAVIALFIVCALPSTIFSQGPLAPPGAPTPTMKSLSDLDTDMKAGGEKRIDVLTLSGDSTNQHMISVAGSYYLSGPIAGVSAKNGISIQAGNVELDLNGYQVVGVAGSLSGVVLASAHRSVVVRNGNISQWGGVGLDLSQGSGGVASEIRSALNTGVGLSAGDGGVVTRCVSRENTGTNFVIGDNATMSHCVAIASGSSNGMELGQGCVLSDCIASQNAMNGIITGAHCNLRQVTANQNAIFGVQLGPHAEIVECVANNNTQEGIFASNRNLVVHCEAVGNSGSGIVGRFGPAVLDSYCELNGDCGILIDEGGAATIRGNICLENGPSATFRGSGIRVTGTGGCRIEQNVASFNYHGIDLQTGGNVVVSTTATGNTLNYSFAVGNHYGPIVDDTATDAADAPAVSGSAAAGDINSTSPWANFSH